MLIIGSFCPKTVLKSNRKVIKNDVFIFIAVRYLIWHTTVDNMACKGLRAISYQGTRNVEAGYKP
jgi:hypothetical protein